MTNVPGFPKYPRKRKNKKNTFSYFAFFPNYSGSTVANGDNDVAMAQGVEGDGGGMGEAPEVNVKPAIIGTEDKFSRSEDEDDNGVMSTNVEPEMEPMSSKEQQKVRSHEYGCLMLPVTPAVDAIVNYWMRRNIATSSLHMDDNKDGFETELHCTLKYGLPDTDPETISQILDGCGPVTLLFGKINKFEKNGFDCIHVEIESDYLRQLNSLITENIQCTTKFSDYRPHITLAWVKSGSCDHLIGNDFFSMLSDTIDEVLFANVDGEEYFISLELE